MIYALLLLSIQSDSIESATVSAQIPDVHIIIIEVENVAFRLFFGTATI